MKIETKLWKDKLEFFREESERATLWNRAVSLQPQDFAYLIDTIDALESEVLKLQKKLETAINGIVIAQTHIKEFDNTGDYHWCVDLTKITLDNTLVEIKKIE